MINSTPTLTNDSLSKKDRVLPAVLAILSFVVVGVGFAAGILGLAFDDAAFKTNHIQEVFLTISTLCTYFFIFAGGWVALILTILSLVNLATQKTILAKIIYISFYTLCGMAALSWVCAIIGVSL